MKLKKLKKETKGHILQIIAVAIDVVVPLVVTYSYFPIWIDRSMGSTIAGVSLSGMFVAFALICFVPAFRQIRDYFKSPSAYVIWTILFVLFLALEAIITEIKIICFFGMVSNYIGAILYNIGKRLKKPSQE